MNPEPASSLSARTHRLIEMHPYLSVAALLLCVEGIIRLIGLLGRTISVASWQQNVIYEALMALGTIGLICWLGWWKESGFGVSIRKRNFAIYIGPIVLFVLPLLCVLSVDVTRYPLWKIGVLLGLALLVGVFEEGLCRGLVLRMLLPCGIVRATFLSALLFALMHLPNLLTGLSIGYVTGQIILAFGLGVLFVALRLRSGSIWMPVFFHATLDSTGFISLLSNPRAIYTTPVTTSLIANGVLCLLCLLNAAILLRPKQLQKLREGGDNTLDATAPVESGAVGVLPSVAAETIVSPEPYTPLDPLDFPRH